jgi:hypothetical protein
LGLDRWWELGPFIIGNIWALSFPGSFPLGFLLNPCEGFEFLRQNRNKPEGWQNIPKSLQVYENGRIKGKNNKNQN